jgi:hypothetical protein
MSKRASPDDRACPNPRPITSWAVIDRPDAFGNPLKTLRMSVAYADGTVKILPPAFADRAKLDKYVARFHPEFAGKERLTGK